MRMSSAVIVASSAAGPGLSRADGLRHAGRGWLRCPGRHRQRERERGAHAHRALDPDAPAVQLHELARESQAEPGPLALPGVIAADLAKLLEDGLVVFRRDAYAG